MENTHPPPSLQALTSLVQVHRTEHLARAEIIIFPRLPIIALPPGRDCAKQSGQHTSVTVPSSAPSGPGPEGPGTWSASVGESLGPGPRLSSPNEILLCFRSHSLAHSHSVARTPEGTKSCPLGNPTMSRWITSASFWSHPHLPLPPYQDDSQEANKV